MRATIVNFADAPRVVYNTESIGVEIAIGQQRDIDIEMPTAKFIMASMRAGDAGLVIVPGGMQIPDTVARALELLRDMETKSQTDMLSAIVDLIGADNIEHRPTQVQMRKALSRVITEFCDDTFPTDGAPAPQPMERSDNHDDAMRTALGELEDDDIEAEEEAPPPAKSKRPKRPAKRVAKTGKTKRVRL